MNSARAVAFDVIVVGAGAAGMMCAWQAARRGRRVLLVDHWKTIGERIRISGGGRCNFTNRHVGDENYLSRNPRFCRSALARFSAADFVALVERHGIAYEERDHGQLFCANAAQDITAMLTKECGDGGVRWAAPCAVGRIERLGPGERGHDARFSVATDGGVHTCRSLVVATGGLAVPQIGATDFGYRVARQLGLSVVPPAPALVPLAFDRDILARLQPLAGVAFDAETRCGSRRPARFRGSVLITHRGLSGPAILQVSSYWQVQASLGGAARPIEIDLLPGIDAAAWLTEHRHGRMLLATVLSERLPRRFAHEWCRIHEWRRRITDLSSRDIASAARTLQAWSLMPAGTLGFTKAEVTLGGVDTADLSSQTMEARRVPGLYFIGEVVDVTGWLGGYNFQWAWSSGWVAGQYA